MAAGTAGPPTAAAALGLLSPSAAPPPISGGAAPAGPGRAGFPARKGGAMPRELEVRRGFLTETQLEAFLAAEDRPVYRLLWLLMADCGLRMAEALRVGVGELVGAEHLRILGKRRRVRHVALTQRIRRLVGETFPFPDELARGHAPADGTGLVGLGPAFTMGARAVQEHFHLTQAKAGLGDLAHLCPHSLRHTFATRLLVAGVDPLSVSALMGHSSLGTTMGYLHTNPDALRRAATALEESPLRAVPPQAPPRLPEPATTRT
jgi:integrase